MLPNHQLFIHALLSRLEPTGGALDHLSIDHLCYRVATEAEYETLKSWLKGDNELLVESIINGRRIATFRMAAPFRYQEREIWLLELPEPKPGSPYPTGWEHAEFVTDRPLADFDRWLTDTLGVPANAIDRSGLAKPLNADLRLRLGDGRSVKFHELPLEEVIGVELAGRGE
jgi:hypothetical protein